jgi:hypothetical protein
MAGKSTEWGSPDLYQNGTWFSDTVLVANDGETASACAAQTLDFNGKIAIFRLNACSMSQSLLNVQNAGATGALIIDDYTGRPLPFDADENSLLVTIPFVLISKTQGDQLLDALNQAEGVSVSFGDKTGVNAVDLGLYMETSLWMRYANQRLPYPHSSMTIDEINYGAWIYNQGSSNAENIQLRLYFSGNNYQEYSAAEVNIIAGDSLYVPFELTEAQLTVQNGNPHIEYGYYLNIENDEDSLDNKVSNRIKNREFWSLSHATFSTSGTPYPINRFIPNPSLDTICVYYKAKSNYFACDFRIATVENAPIEERMLLCHDLENWDYNFFLTEAPITGSAFFSDLQQNNYLIPESGYTLTKNEFAACLYIYESNNSIFSLGFSTEMYHDERIRQEGRPFVYRYNNGEMIESDPRLLPIIPIKFKYSDCFYGLEEYKQNTIQFFPNPNSGTFRIVSENGIENIQIFHLSGQQAANLYYANTPSEIELQLQLVPGMYLIKLKSNGEDVVGKMIVE